MIVCNVSDAAVTVLTCLLTYLTYAEIVSYL